jgi:predicted alpha/beta-hydrolase family hydrolase
MMRMHLTASLLGLSLALLSVPLTSPERALTAFSDAYPGAGNGVDCDTSYAISGMEPSDSARHAVFVYLVGTGESHDNAQARAAIAGMGARGFVAAAVQYHSAVFGSCAEIARKAACIFKPESPHSAISRLCARGDCSKGIVVGGASQGAIVAILAKNTDARVQAAYGMGALPNYTTYDMTRCMADGAHDLAGSKLRIVNGERDFFGGGTAATVRAASRAVTGKACDSASHACLNGNGSGWIMVRNEQVEDGSADHCFQRGPMNTGRDCLASENVLDAEWRSGSASWTLPSGLNWLAQFATP